MSNFFHRLFRSTRDPRYRIMCPDPFPDFRDYVFAMEAAYIARDLSEDHCLPRNDKFSEQADKDFSNRFYPRLEWPDWLAAVLFFGTSIAILVIAVRVSPWGLTAPPLILSVLWGRALRESRRYRQWRAEKQRYLHARHIRRQRSVTWQYQ